jgi:hypothetical protein
MSAFAVGTLAVLLLDRRWRWLAALGGVATLAAAALALIGG